MPHARRTGQQPCMRTARNQGAYPRPLRRGRNRRDALIRRHGVNARMMRIQDFGQPFTAAVCAQNQRAPPRQRGQAQPLVERVRQRFGAIRFSILRPLRAVLNRGRNHAVIRLGNPKGSERSRAAGPNHANRHLARPVSMRQMRKRIMYRILRGKNNQRILFKHCQCARERRIILCRRDFQQLKLKRLNMMPGQCLPQNGGLPARARDDSGTGTRQVHPRSYSQLSKPFANTGEIDPSRLMKIELPASRSARSSAWSGSYFIEGPAIPAAYTQPWEIYCIVPKCGGVNVVPACPCPSWSIALESGKPFHGLVDIDLTEQGILEARRAGQLLKALGYHFDIAYTSVLKRAIRTLWHIQDELAQMYIPVIHSWRLNERHYGALTGLNKDETTARYGAAQVLQWRRRYDCPPPALERARARALYDDPRYAKLSPAQRPLTESLQDTVARVVPLWNESIAPALKAGKRILMVAHGNSLRALMQYLEHVSAQDIVHLNIPNSIPLGYTFDAPLKPRTHTCLAPVHG